MRSPNWWTELKLWIEFHKEAAGFLAMTTVTLLVIAVGASVGLPKRGEHDLPIDGIVTQIIPAQGKSIRQLKVVVATEDGHGAVIAPVNPSNCHIGSRINVARRRTWWGSLYMADYGSSCAP